MPSSINKPTTEADSTVRAKRLRASRSAPPSSGFAPRFLCGLLVLLVAFAAPLSSALVGVAQSGRGRQPQQTSSPKPAASASRPRAVKIPPASEPPVTTETNSTVARPQPTPTPAATPRAQIPTNTQTPVASPSSPGATNKAASPSDSSTAEEVDDEEVVRVNSNLVPVPASVLDAQGRAIVDLELKDFELRVDGELKPIGDVSRAETPVRMAVLFDNSASMRASREFEQKAAIQFFKTVMRPVDQAALYAVSTDPTLVRPLTGDVKALVRAIENFPPPEGATSLFDAIVQAAEYLRPYTYRKVIVIVSDGVETTSRIESFDEVLRFAQAADCQIYAVQTGASDNPNLRDLVAERRLQVFAAETGGAVYRPNGASDLDRAFAQISADLAQQYILSYYPSEQRRDGRFHPFSLRVSTRPGLRVRTRKGYYAPKG